MKIKEVLSTLKELGTAQNRKIYTNHGCDLDQYGVSISDLKKVYKTIKNDKTLGKELFMSGNADAIYLSKWMISIDDLQKTELFHVINQTNYYLILENVIPDILVKNQNKAQIFVFDFISSQDSKFRQIGYSLLALMLSVYPNDSFDDNYLSSLVDKVETTIHSEKNRVKYSMNNYLISLGVYHPGFTETILGVNERIGIITVNMGNTACKVPNIKTYIEKNKERNQIGVKRKRRS